MPRQKTNNEIKPFDFKLCAASFMAGALFVLMPFLYVCHQCHQHVQTETMLRNQLLAEHYNNQSAALIPAVPMTSAGIKDMSEWKDRTAPNFPVHRLRPIQSGTRFTLKDFEVIDYSSVVSPRKP